jgi:hypothetical protein
MSRGPGIWRRLSWPSERSSLHVSAEGLRAGDAWACARGCVMGVSKARPPEVMRPVVPRVLVGLVGLWLTCGPQK